MSSLESALPAAIGAADDRPHASDAVRAHLRSIGPGADFRIVLTLRPDVCNHGEAILTPIEAAILLSEIAEHLGEGDRLAAGPAPGL